MIKNVAFSKSSSVFRREHLLDKVKEVKEVFETEILVEQQPPQGVLVCDHAGLVINKLSLCTRRSNTSLTAVRNETAVKEVFDRNETAVKEVFGRRVRIPITLLSRVHQESRGSDVQHHRCKLTAFARSSDAGGGISKAKRASEADYHPSDAGVEAAQGVRVEQQPPQGG